MLSGVVHEVRQRTTVGDPVAPSTMPGSSAPPYRVVTVRVLALPPVPTDPLNQTPVRLAALKVAGVCTPPARVSAKFSRRTPNQTSTITNANRLCLCHVAKRINPHTDTIACGIENGRRNV